MADIRGLRGIRYSPDVAGRDLSALLAPPYDVLAAADKAALLNRDARNIVAVDLPHVPPKQAGPDEVYAQAARQLDAWQSQGLLRRDDTPALYRYHQTFAHEGRTLTRRMLIGRLRLERFGAGSVYPHELTFPGAKADRLKLMQATRCNLSAVFAVFSDPDSRIHEQLGAPGQADVEGTVEGVRNELWVVDQPSVCDAVSSALADRKVYIADGHHRYETALTYRNGLAATNGALPDDDPAQFVLVVLAAMEDPGLLMLPTHRVVELPGGFDVDAWLRRLGESFSAEPMAGDDPAALVGSLGERGASSIGVIWSGGRSAFCMQPKSDDVLASPAPRKSPAWRRLAVSILHEYVLPDLATQSGVDNEALHIQYVKDAGNAVQLATDLSNGIAFLLPSIELAALRAVCEAGDVMPQKSTYFYPKVATGLVINSLGD